mgnify:CR=1 FL=1
MGDEESRKERTSGGVSVQLEEEQKCLLKELQTAVERQEDKEHLEELLWKTLTVFQGCPFYTVKNLEFVYEIRGNEMFVNRKDKSITRASISLAFEKALELQKTEGTVKGPKKLNCFGASYLIRSLRNWELSGSEKYRMDNCENIYILRVSVRYFLLKISL